MQRNHYVCVLLLQEYECRVSLLSDMLLQRESAAGDTQKLTDDLTQRLSDTASEAFGLHQQGATSRVVCCNTHNLTTVCLHTATLTASRSCCCCSCTLCPILSGTEVMLLLSFSGEMQHRRCVVLTCVS